MQHTTCFTGEIADNISSKISKYTTTTSTTTTTTTNNNNNNVTF